MDIGLDISQHQLTWPELLGRTLFAEETGFSSAWVFDHFKPLYGDPGGPCFEGWSSLAALGASTERIRLGSLVTGVTYRHPSLLTAEAVTVDHITGGRLNLGMGAAWFEGEHDELGFDFPAAGERLRRLEEAINVAKLLMTEDAATFEGRYYTLRGASYNPKPVQDPHPPIWVGGGGERKTLPLAGRLADVWHGYGNVSTLTRKSDIVSRAAEAAGRDPSDVKRATNLSISEPWDQVRRFAERVRDAGFEFLIVSWPSEGKARLDEFVESVMPELVS